MGKFGAKSILRPPSSIVNYASAGGVSHYLGDAGTYLHENGKVYASGALTANTYKELVAVSGSGFVSLAAVRGIDATSRTVGLKIIIDGVTIFDAVSATITSDQLGLVGIGSQKYASAGHSEDFPIPYYSSLSISVKSSNAETDKVNAVVSYRTVASGFGSSPLLEPPTSIVNYCSGGSVQVGHALAYYQRNAKQTLSGALTANTYKELLAVTGAGTIGFCAVTAVDTTSRTVSLKLVIDGVTVFDAASSTITVAHKGLVAIGAETGITSAPLGGWSPAFPATYKSSFAVSIKSSNSETDVVRMHCNYNPS